MYYEGVWLDIVLLPYKSQNIEQLKALYPKMSQNAAWVSNVKRWSKERIRKVILETLYRRQQS